MRTLFLEAHNDDVALFAAYGALAAEDGHIITCLRSYMQNMLPVPVSYEARETESRAAARVLGCSSEQWTVRDDYGAVTLEHLLQARAVGTLAGDWERVYAPLPLEGGHEHHNILGRLAQAYVPAERLTLYCTYRRGEGRMRSSREVEAPAEWAAVKYLAMAAFASQINEPTCQPWFVADDALREWVA